MEKTKVAVIGLGGIAQLVHLPILSKLMNVEISAIADIKKNQLNSVSEKFNIEKHYTDHREMLEKEEVDAVIIATPTNTHLEIALDCLKAGKHILIEKPIARNVSEAKQINAASKKYKKQVMVGMNLRYRPDAMLLKSLVNSGELGDIFYIRCGWLRKQSNEQKWFININRITDSQIINKFVRDSKRVTFNKFNFRRTDMENILRILSQLDQTTIGIN